VLGLLSASETPPKTAKTNESSGEKLFDADPAHPWNRLHSFFYGSSMPGADFCIHRRPDEYHKPSWLEGASHEKAIRILDDFLKAKDDERIKKPLPRALLQGDLWYVFDKLEEEPSFGEETPFQEIRRRRAIQKRLALVMRRLEQPAARLQALPDNYAVAIRGGKFPTKFDPEHPQRAYLPADFRLDGKGDWVSVRSWREVLPAPKNLRSGRATTSLSAPTHYHSAGGKSVFLTLLRLPGSRKDTENYLASFPDRGDQKKGFRPLPAGSQVALVRRMLLPDDRGNLQATSVTESVQLRIFPRRGEQYVFEFGSDPAGLLSSRGGLWAIEDKSVLANCKVCHKVERDGLNSITTFGFGLTVGYQGVAQTRWNEQAEISKILKKQSYSWGLLQGLREMTP